MPDITQNPLLLFKFSQPPCDACPIISSGEKRRDRKIKVPAQDHRGTQQRGQGLEPWSLAHSLCHKAQGLSKVHRDVLVFFPNAPNMHPMFWLCQQAPPLQKHQGLSYRWLCTCCLFARWPSWPHPVKFCSFFSYLMRTVLIPWIELITHLFVTAESRTHSTSIMVLTALQCEWGLVSSQSPLKAGHTAGLC